MVSEAAGVSHEAQMETIRRKFALEVRLGSMSYDALCQSSSKALAREFDISAHWAGAALRTEMRRRP